MEGTAHEKGANYTSCMQNVRQIYEADTENIGKGVNWDKLALQGGRVKHPKVAHKEGASGALLMCDPVTGSLAQLRRSATALW
jgi:hypothetical protein